jgi:hypothetical protein
MCIRDRNRTQDLVAGQRVESLGVGHESTGIPGEVKLTRLKFSNNAVQTQALPDPGTTGNTLVSIGSAWRSVANNIPLGVNQTWQLMTVPSQRSGNGTTYTNDTGRPISISARLVQDDGQISLTVDGLKIDEIGGTAGPANLTVAGIIPAGSTYSVVSTLNTVTTLFWYELR